jgi:hypothetical protein
MRHWRSPGRGSAPAVRRFSIGFDDETADQVRALAAADRVSFAEKARQLVEWGLEAVQGDAQRRPVPDKGKAARASARSENR